MKILLRCFFYSLFISIPMGFFLNFSLAIIMHIFKITLNPFKEGCIVGCIFGVLLAAILSYFLNLEKLKEKDKEIQILKQNRDIEQIIKIEEEKWEIQKKKEEIQLFNKITSGEYVFKISSATLKQVVFGLKNENFTLKLKNSTTIEINDNWTRYTITSTPFKKNNASAPYFKDLLSHDIPITRRVAKKDFINALKIISTPNVEITFNHNNMDIEVKNPTGQGTIINLTALN